jgi:hypothetical protein
MADSVVGRLIYKITGDVSDIKRSLTNTERQIKKFTKFVQSAAGLFGAAAAFKMLTSVVKDLVKAGLENEQNELKLATAMKISGQAAAGQVKQLTGLAKALSLVTTYTDDETVAAMTTLTEVGSVSAKGMRELIPLVQDLASGLGMDLGTASDLVAKTLSGNTGALGRYGIKIKETKDPVERFSEVVKTLTERFGGMSEAMAASAGGGLKQITQQFDELKEAVGTRLLQTFKGTIAALSSRVNADVVLGIKTAEVGSPEEATAYLKTLRTELDRLRAAAKADPSLLLHPSHTTVSATVKRIADLQNKIEGLTRFMAGWKEAEIEMPPVLARTTEQTEAAAKAAQKLTDERKKEAQTIADTGERARNEEWNDIIKSTEAQRDLLREQAEERIRLEEEVAARVQKNIDEDIAAHEEAARERLRIEQEAADQIQQIRESSFSFVSDLLSTLNDIQRANLSSELAALEARQESELAAFEGTEEEKTKLTEKFAKEKAKLEYDAALKSWQLQLAGAIVSGAKAILSGFETQPFVPAGLIAGGLATALAAVQLAAIRAAKPVPNFATGADFTVPAGYPNDSYPMNVESGEHVTVTPAGADGGAATPLIIQIDALPIYKGMLQATGNRIALINARSIVK